MCNFYIFLLIELNSFSIPLIIQILQNKRHAYCVSFWCVLRDSARFGVI